MGKKLYVGNLSYSVTSSDLEQLFGQHGQVTSAQVINDRDTGRSKGFGFVDRPLGIASCLLLPSAPCRTSPASVGTSTSFNPAPKEPL